MINEIKIIAGLHDCGRELDIRMLDNDAPMFWLIYGFCKKCNVVQVCAIFDRLPVDGVDYIIDYNLVAEVSHNG